MLTKVRDAIRYITPQDDEDWGCAATCAIVVMVMISMLSIVFLFGFGLIRWGFGY